MPVQYYDSLDLNGNKITELAAGVASTDAVNVSQLTSAGVQSFKQTFGDGTATSFTFTHNLGTLDVLVEFYLASGGNTVHLDPVRATTNTVTLTVPVAPSTNQFRVLIVKVP